jgi:hypothetical protein
MSGSMCIGWVGDTPNTFRASPEYILYLKEMINTQNRDGWSIEPVGYAYEQKGLILLRVNINCHDLII